MWTDCSWCGIAVTSLEKEAGVAIGQALGTNQNLPHLDLRSKWAYGVVGSWTERALRLFESGGSDLLQCCARGRVLVD